MSNELLLRYITENFDKLDRMYTNYLGRSNKKYNNKEFKIFAEMVLDGREDVEIKFDKYYNSLTQV